MLTPKKLIFKIQYFEAQIFKNLSFSAKAIYYLKEDGNPLISIIYANNFKYTYVRISLFASSFQ